jgi:glutaredoxin 3
MVLNNMDNQPKIRIFSTPSCPYCYTLKEYFKEHNLAFDDIDVSSDSKLLDEMVAKSGQMTVPVLEIGGEIIIGFDKKKINELLNIKD